MRWLKILALVLAGLLILLLVAIAIFWWRFDPNSYRAWIAAKVQETTGRSLVIEGDLRLALAPELVLQADRIQLADAAGFGPESFLSADHIQASLRLWPLLRGRLDAGELRIEGLDLRLRTNANGQTNWQDLQARLPKSDGSPANYAVAAVKLQRATITYRDAQAGKQWRVADLDITTDRIAPPASFSFVTQFTVAELPAAPTAKLGLKAAITLDPEHERYLLERPQLEVEWRRAGIAPLAMSAAAESLALDLRQSTAQGHAVTIDAAGAHLAAEVSAQQLSGTPMIDGTVTATPFALREALAAVGVAVPATADPKALSRAGFTAQFELQGSTIRLEQMVAELDDSNLQGRLAVDFSGEPAMAFDLQADRMDVDRYLSPAKVKQQTKAVAESMDVPMESLQKLQADGVIVVALARVAGIELHDARILLTTHNNRIKLRQRPTIGAPVSESQ